MKLIYIFILLALVACNTKRNSSAADSSVAPAKENPSDTMQQRADSLPQLYANERFRNVTVTNLGNDRFLIEGEGQIFEANFGWAVEDGHLELKKGHEMTDAGAPEWGKFKFIVEVEKQRPNSSLTLVLFESSAKDGTRQYELPLVLQ